MPSFPHPKTLLIVGDVHGDLGRALTLLVQLRVVTFDAPTSRITWVAEPGTMLVQMGDQLDSAVRCQPGGGAAAAEGWETHPDTSVVELFAALESMALARGCRVLSLLGNHEIMNCLGAFEYCSPESLAMTGGAAGRRALLAPGSDFCRRYLADRPLFARVGNLLLSHAGVLPRHLPALGRLNNECRDWLRGGPATESLRVHGIGERGVTWTREYDPDGENEPATRVCRALGLEGLVVGHTPVGAVTQARGGVWFVDTGISRAFGRSQFQVLRISEGGRREVLQVRVAPTANTTS